MANSKTRKVLDINVDGVNLYCTFRENETENPYHLYKRWYEYKGDRDYGWRRKQIARYQNLYSVICYIKGYCEGYHVGFTDVWEGKENV